MTIRPLSPTKEKVIAYPVFQGTIPYSRVRITDAIGLRNAPYTLVYAGAVSMGGGDDEDARRNPDRYEDHWHINVGKAFFPGLEKSAYGKSLFIHELTHVWQSAQSVWPAAYIFNSVWHQATEGASAYNYSPGDPWNSYNVEQQAHIVEDWFARGMQPGDANYRYIKDNIRVARKFK